MSLHLEEALETSTKPLTPPEAATQTTTSSPTLDPTPIARTASSTEKTPPPTPGATTGAFTPCTPYDPTTTCPEMITAELLRVNTQLAMLLSAALQCGLSPNENHVYYSFAVCPVRNMLTRIDMPDCTEERRKDSVQEAVMRGEHLLMLAGLMFNLGEGMKELRRGFVKKAEAKAGQKPERRLTCSETETSGESKGGGSYMPDAQSAEDDCGLFR